MQRREQNSQRDSRRSYSPSQNKSKRSQTSRNRLTNSRHELTQIKYLSIVDANENIWRISMGDPALGQSLRWIRNTPINRVLLSEYLIDNFIIQKLLHSSKWQMYYCPKYNQFIRRKPETEEVDFINFNPLKAFLDKNQESEVLAFRKEVKKKNENGAVLGEGLIKILTSELEDFFKLRAPLKKMDDFISSLPQKQGCFQFPVSKFKLNTSLEESLVLLDKNGLLKFKVDLVGYGSLVYSGNRSYSSSPVRTRKISSKEIRSNQKKSNKKLKVEYLSAEKIFPSNISSLGSSEEQSEPPTLDEPEPMLRDKSSCFDLEERVKACRKLCLGTSDIFEELDRLNPIELFHEDHPSSAESHSSDEGEIEEHIMGLMARVDTINLESVDDSVTEPPRQDVIDLTSQEPQTTKQSDQSLPKFFTDF